MKKRVLLFAMAILVTSILSACTNAPDVEPTEPTQIVPSEPTSAIKDVSHYVFAKDTVSFTREDGEKVYFTYPNLQNLPNSIIDPINQELDDKFKDIFNGIPDEKPVQELIDYSSHIYTEILTVTTFEFYAGGSISNNIYNIDLLTQELLDNKYFQDNLNLSDEEFIEKIIEIKLAYFESEYPKENYIGTDSEEFYNSQLELCKNTEYAQNSILYFTHDGILTLYTAVPSMIGAEIYNKHLPFI